MQCEKCCQTTQLFTCSKCKTGYYCSKECQAGDWPTHKKFCKLWGKNNIFLNPFYAENIIKTPTRLPTKEIDDRFVNYSRGLHGDTLLHLAVISGDIDKINGLLDINAYINSVDYRLATPLYYACSHPGENEVLKKNIPLREQVVQLLMDRGADPFCQSGFSGMNSFKAAKHYNYSSLEVIIKTHKYFKIWENLRKNFNMSSPPPRIDRILKKYYDLYWRSNTIHWLFSPTRENMMNIKPHLKVLENLDTGDVSNSIEALFVDCYYRHQKMMKEFDEY